MSNVQKSDLIGSWKLISFFIEDESGYRIYPLSENVTGRLLYTENKMSGMMYNSELGVLSSEIVSNVTATEKSRLAESFIGYTGNWDVDGDKIIHKIEMSYIPNQIKREEVRYFDLSDNTLQLKTDPITINETTFVAHVNWERELP